MRLSALDCIGRGIANLRANWELALMQLAQSVACALLTLLGVLGVGMVLGVSVFRRLADVTNWQDLLGELEGLSPSWGLLVILFSGALILTTLVTLVYSWFQAAIFTTLERGERQAPPAPRADPQLFRTFEGRCFWGWGTAGVWRYFWFLGWAVLVATSTVGLLVVAAVAAVVLLADSMGPGVLAIGCLALVPVAGLAVGLNFWMLFGQALLPRERFSVLAVSGVAWRILRRRFGAWLLLALLFVVASVMVALVFGLLTQVLSLILDGATAVWIAVQILMTAAQWLASSILSVALFGSVVALACNELDMRTA